MNRQTRKQNTANSAQQITGNRPIFKDISSGLLGELEANGVLYATDTSDNVKHKFRKIGNDLFWDIDTGKKYTESELNKFTANKFTLKVVDQQEMTNVANIIKKRQFSQVIQNSKIKHSVELDVETFIKHENKTATIDDLYSLSMSRIPDKIETRKDTGRGAKYQIPLFATMKKGADGKWEQVNSTASEIYTSQKAKHNKATSRLAIAANEVTNAAYVQNAQELGLLTTADVNIIKKGNISQLDSNPVEYKKAISRFIEVKQYAKQNQYRPFIKVSGDSSVRNLKVGEAFDRHGGFYDQAGFESIIKEKLNNEDVFGGSSTKKAYGGAIDEYISKYTDIAELKKIYDAADPAQKPAVLKEIQKKAATTFQKNTGAMLVDIRSGGVDSSALYSTMLESTAYGNQGSEMETNITRDLGRKIKKNNNLDSISAVFGSRVDVIDSMGPQLNTLAGILEHGWQGNKKLGPTEIKAAFKDLYGSNKEFLRLTGLSPKEAEQLKNTVYDRLLDPYAGNKSIEAKQRQSGLSIPYHHIAQTDSAGAALSDTILNQRLFELNEIASQPPTAATAYKKRVLQTTALNDLISEEVRIAVQKVNPGISEDHLYRIQSDLKNKAMKRSGLSDSAQEMAEENVRLAINKKLAAGKNQPSSFAKNMTQATGTTSLPGMFGGALLTSGVVTAASALSAKMRNHPMTDSKDRVEGLSHNSMETVLRRLDMTDFGSTRKPGNPSSNNTLRMFWDTLTDTEFVKSAKETQANFSKNVKESLKRDNSIRGLINGVTGSGTRSALLNDTVNTMSFINKGASNAISTGIPAIGKFVQDNLIKPTKELFKGQSGLSKVITSSVFSRVGTFALVGAGVGFALHAIATKTADSKPKTKEEYTKDSKIPSVNSFNAERMNMTFADTLQAMNKPGMGHGGLGREMNRVHMTDFRSALMTGAPVAHLVTDEMMAPSHPTTVDATSMVRSQLSTAPDDRVNTIAESAKSEVANSIQTMEMIGSQPDIMPDSAPTRVDSPDRLGSYDNLNPDTDGADWIERTTGRRITSQPSFANDSISTPDVTEWVSKRKDNRRITTTPTEAENRRLSVYSDVPDAAPARIMGSYSDIGGDGDARATYVDADAFSAHSGNSPKMRPFISDTQQGYRGTTEENMSGLRIRSSILEDVPLSRKNKTHTGINSMFSEPYAPEQGIGDDAATGMKSQHVSQSGISSESAHGLKAQNVTESGLGDANFYGMISEQTPDGKTLRNQTKLAPIHSKKTVNDRDKTVYTIPSVVNEKQYYEQQTTNKEKPVNPIPEMQKQQSMGEVANIGNKQVIGRQSHQKNVTNKWSDIHSRKYSLAQSRGAARASHNLVATGSVFGHHGYSGTHNRGETGYGLFGGLFD